MIDSPILAVGLPIALGTVMFGLGLSLTVFDFRRVITAPRAVMFALMVQMLVLPALAFGLVVAFELNSALSVGLILLASSPGGTSASLFSHLFRGDVALNLTLTAINAVLAAFTVPVITNLATQHFDIGGAVGLQFGKMAQLIAVILVPVVMGMATKHFRPKFAEAADRPMRTLSVLILIAITSIAIVQERARITEYLYAVGFVVVVFCVLSLSIGFLGARMMRLKQEQAIAISMEVGIHNSTVALTVALGVLQNAEIAIPAAVYGVSMYAIAAAFGFLVSRRYRADAQAAR